MVAAFRVEGGGLSKGEWNDRRASGEVSSQVKCGGGTGLRGTVVMILGVGGGVWWGECPALTLADGQLVREMLAGLGAGR